MYFLFVLVVSMLFGIMLIRVYGKYGREGESKGREEEIEVKVFICYFMR